MDGSDECGRGIRIYFLKAKVDRYAEIAEGRLAR